MAQHSNWKTRAYTTDLVGQRKAGYITPMLFAVYFTKIFVNFDRISMLRATSQEEISAVLCQDRLLACIMTFRVYIGKQVGKQEKVSARSI